MNKQRKVLITITYNEMGIIIDTKTEELGSSAQPEKRTEESTGTHGACLDTISRQAAQRLFGKALTYKERNGKLTWTTSEVKQWIADCIEQLPPAQPEIIRCKDCKHWIPYDWMFSEVWQSKNIADYPEDEIGCNYCDMAMKANDFCSRGERRTDERSD